MIQIFYLSVIKIKIACLEDDRRFFESDVDGEKGPDLPLDIEVIKKGLKVFSNI